VAMRQLPRGSSLRMLFEAFFKEIRLSILD
jgi:hypothetical protein